MIVSSPRYVETAYDERDLYFQLEAPEVSMCNMMQEELSKFMAMEVWVIAKEQSAKELRSKKTEVEQMEGALEQLSKQYEQLQKKVRVCCSCPSY